MNWIVRRRDKFALHDEKPDLHFILSIREIL